MTCRLPQTPRTPTTAAAHYFDDVLSTISKPKKPSNLRRSSTTRSIGFRSDWETSTNGDDDDAVSPIRRKNSVGYLDEDAIKAKQAIEERFNNYVSGQLERVKTGQNEYEPDEFETSLDGASEKPSKGSKKSNGHRGRSNYFEQDPYFSK
jgi:hypothetical protein